MKPVAKFITPGWEDKVDSGIGLSYWPSLLHWLSGRYDNPMQESTIFPVKFSDYEFGYAAVSGHIFY